MSAIKRPNGTNENKLRKVSNLRDEFSGWFGRLGESFAFGLGDILRLTCAMKFSVRLLRLGLKCLIDFLLSVHGGDYSLKHRLSGLSES